MFLVHLRGPGVDVRREWFDTSHPALAPFTRDSPTERGRQRWLIPPWRIGDDHFGDLTVAGLERTHVILEQPSPGEVRVRAPQPTSALFVNGARVFETLPLPPGAVLRFEGHALTLERTEPLGPKLLARLARLMVGDGEAWRVYADELEESGRVELAQWMRLEREVTSATRPQLATLGSTLSPSERATVGTAKVLGCEEPQCPGRWDALRITSEARFRDCAQCNKSVAWCDRQRDAEAFVARGLRAVPDAGAQS